MRPADIHDEDALKIGHIDDLETIRRHKLARSAGSLAAGMRFVFQGLEMPLVDTDDLRRARADFVRRFSDRPYFFVRAATPQVLVDQVERVLEAE